MIDLSAYKAKYREPVAFIIKFLPYEEDVPESKDELLEFYTAVEEGDLDKAKHVMWALSRDSLRYADTFYTVYLELDAITWDINHEGS